MVVRTKTGPLPFVWREREEMGTGSPVGELWGGDDYT
jgi:hypothetical protein